VKHIIVHGFYGMGNLGDDAILTAIVRQIKQKNHHLTVISKNPTRVQSEYNIEAFHENHGMWGYMKRRAIIKQSDLFLLGGGGIIKDFGSSARLLKKWFKNIILARKLGKKTALFAVGVENILYEESIQFLKKTLGKIDIISVRDEISKVKLEELGIKKEINVIADPVLMLGQEEEPPVKQLPGTMTILVCLRHWFKEGFYINDEKSYSDALLSLQEALSWFITRHNARIIFLPLRTISHDNDTIVNEKVAAGIPDKQKITVHTRVPGIDEFLTLAGQCTFILGMRLHSLILGATTGTPVIGLEYMPKVKGFMQELHQADNSINLETLKAEDIINKGEYIIRHYTEISKKIRHRVMELRKKNRVFIHQLLGE
jgi:polysaccharide pyruvyl transferase CsaB